MARPSRQHMLKMLKNSTRLLVDSATQIQSMIIGCVAICTRSYSCVCVCDVPLVSRISSSCLRMCTKSCTIESDRSSSRVRSISSGFSLAASPSCARNAKHVIRLYRYGAINSEKKHTLKATPTRGTNGHQGSGI